MTQFTCHYPNCTDPPKVRGYCRAHYEKLMRAGKLERIGPGWHGDKEAHQEIARQAAQERWPKCKCGKTGSDDHTCPYKADIYDDYESLRNCCASCQYECAQDI